MSAVITTVLTRRRRCRANGKWDNLCSWRAVFAGRQHLNSELQENTVLVITAVTAEAFTDEKDQ